MSQDQQAAQPGRRGGVVIGGVVAAVVVVAAGVGVFVAHHGSSGSSGLHDDGKKYVLTTPETVAGDYTKTSVGSPVARLDQAGTAKLAALGVTEPTSTSQMYVKGNVADGVYLNFSGVSGTVADPAKALDGAFALLEDGGRPDRSGTTLKAATAGGPQSVHPAGMAPDALMKCQKFVETVSQDNQKVPSKTTVCVWADYSTLAYLFPLDPTATLNGTETASVADAAALTAKVRKDVEVAAS
ncbi:hypothetical protein [Actinacidiphila sp. bgisy145]|uniref:hypothetical protein n=1 Tax=Actinacidiphila sp. bgisy145 TaxID=3413792 RepID=UPI003EBC85F4